MSRYHVEIIDNESGKVIERTDTDNVELIYGGQNAVVAQSHFAGSMLDRLSIVLSLSVAEKKILEEEPILAGLYAMQDRIINKKEIVDLSGIYTKEWGRKEP